MKGGREMRKKSVVVAKGSRLREEPKRETREKVAKSFFVHETEKLQRREPVIPGLLSQKLLNIMTVVLRFHKRRWFKSECCGL